MSNREFSRDNLVFRLRQENAGGLRRPLSNDGRRVRRVDCLPTYQGYAGVLHGGVISTLMDEVMAHAVLSRVGRAPTVEIACSS